MSHNSPNPTDPTVYTLIDNFNRAGNIIANSVPELGPNWDAQGGGLLLTNAAGYLEFPVGTSYIPAGDQFAMTGALASVKGASFEVSYGTAGKALFFGIRNNSLNPRTGFINGEVIEVRLRDVGADFMVTIQNVKDVNVSVILAEVRIGDAVGANNKTPITITDDGKRITIQALGNKIFLNTTLYAGNQSILIGTNLDSLVQLSKLRVW